MIKDRTECKYWTSWYCIKKRLPLLTDETKSVCKGCKLFISKEGDIKNVKVKK